MAEIDPVELLLVDPLSQVTRKARTRLLTLGLLAIVVAKAHVVPTRISALGVEFTETNQKTLLVLTAAVLVYLLLEFAIYAFFDIGRTGVGVGNALRHQLSRHSDVWRGDAFRYMFMVRAVFFEFALPVVLGIYAIVALYRAK
jgi:hypothetical protein